MDTSVRPQLLLLVLAAFIVGAVVLWSSAAQDEDDTPTAAHEPERTLATSGSARVTYQVFGTACAASITMETPTGTSQASNRALPLTPKGETQPGLSFLFPRGAFVYISAQNECESGWIGCTIKTAEGTELARSRSEGGFTIATCDGSAE